MFAKMYRGRMSECDVDVGGKRHVAAHLALVEVRA